MAQRERKQTLTKREYMSLGGPLNSRLFRKQKKGGAWKFYMLLGDDAP
jgi:hypothetical protein